MKHGIKKKLVLSLVITTLIILLVFVLLSNLFLRKYSKNELENTIIILGNNVSLSLQTSLFNQDYNRLKNIVESVIIDEFDYLIVYDNQTPNVAFQHLKSIQLESLQLQSTITGKTEFETKILEFNGHEYTQYLFPVRVPQVAKPLGFLIIGVSKEKMESALSGITFRLILFSGLLFLALTITITIFSGRIVHPLRGLSAMVEKMSQGDYSVRSEIKTRDEVGALAHSFNIMADKLNEQIGSIGRYSKNLEEMVAERTHELQQALENIKDQEEKLNRVKNINTVNNLVNAIAHEINNPMAIISGNIQMMESDQNINLPNIKRIKAVNEAIRRIETLINDINFLSTIKDMTIHHFSFANLVSRVIKDVVPKGIKIEVSGCQEDYINSNQNMISICMENILQNSVNVILQRGIQGEITVNYFIRDNYFVIEISDNGGGMQEPHKVFEPFYSTNSEGKGLGLTFVYHAIQALNGSLLVENIHQGVKVTIRLERLTTST